MWPLRIWSEVRMGGTHKQTEQKVMIIKHQHQYFTFSNKGILHGISHPRLYFYLQCSFFIH